LSKVTEALFEKSLCKVEQVSNWERRPLRKSQAHYASLDAYILILIIEILMKKTKYEKINQLEKCVKTIDNRGDENKNEEKVDNGEDKKVGKKRNYD